MKNITKHTGTLRIVERMPSSKNGNPRYMCFLEETNGEHGVSFNTGVDSSHGYGITNYENKKVTVHIGSERNKPTLKNIYECNDLIETFKLDDVKNLDNDQHFICIVSNGSKWAGDEPDSIDKLYERLNKHKLDPAFNFTGGFIRDIDLDYFKATNIKSFFGNFETLSAGFNIYTNDPKTIKKLHTLIMNNKSYFN